MATAQTFPGFYPERNPLDNYRAHIATSLSEVSGVDSSIVWPAVQWTSALEKGDFIIACAALRIKGKKPNELAVELAEKVGGPSSLVIFPMVAVLMPISLLPSSPLQSSLKGQ